MEYKCQKLNSKDVLALLVKAENSFTPPLSHNIPYSLKEYAERLSGNAFFILCVDHEETLGFTAYYINTEGKFAYIPQIWVSDKYQRKGIGATMINKMIELLPSNIDSIRLEVRKNNEKAYSFYAKSNFVVLAEKNGKLLMGKRIVR